MKYAQITAFEKHLLSAAPDNFSGVYCLLVKDPAERQFCIDEFRRLIKTDARVEWLSYSADPKRERELLQNIDTPSLFSTRQVMQINIGEKLSKPTMEALEKSFSTLPRSLTLLFTAETLNRQTTFYKAIEKHGVVFDMGEEKPWEKEKSLAEWLMGRVRSEKINIPADCVNQLVRGVNGNLAELGGEWNKLLSFLGTRKEVNEKDLAAVCLLTPVESTWQLGEAILQNNAEKALKVVFQAIEQGQNSITLLRQLRHQMMTALQLLSGAKTNSLDTVSKKFPYLKGAMLDRQLNHASQYGLERLSRAVQLIDSFEFKAKDQWDDPELLFTALIARLTHA